MSLAAHDDECPGCKPVMVDVQTGAVMPDDAPTMQAVLRVWSTLSRVEKQAWHRFTCQNSRLLTDVQHAAVFTQRVQAALIKEST